ncbi:Gfo/Idh/MocA family protein [Limimaricola soesokkakensis]|uniref:Gfo/Idh/MocA family protein n=1 Tax=Limimaricola soesokkakensis TaxID=1343159 RepID=UPI003513781B
MRGALIGCGFFAQNQLHAWRDIEGVEIVALCDRDPERLKRSGADFGIDKHYMDAAEMLATEHLDFVDIATTAPTHRLLVEQALRAGAHVICQKPFAETMADARAMVATAQATGLTLMVHENFRWQSPVRRVIELLREGAIGTPFFARVSFRSGYDVYSGQPYLAEGERFIIEDLGIHILDIARALLGDAVRISATTRRVNPRIRGEDVATMLLEHEGGATSVVDCSYASRRARESFPETAIEIDGELGTLKLEPGYRLVIECDGETVEDVAPTLLPWAERPWHNIQESVAIIQRHFIDCLGAGRAPETSAADNLHTLALVEAAYVSAAEKRIVELMEI